MFQNKNILVTGGSGMIGRALTSKLLDLGANVTVVDLHCPSELENKVTYINKDLRYLQNCEEICENKDYENAYSVRIEFCEWLDPQIEEHDIVSLEYIGEQEDDTRSS